MAPPMVHSSSQHHAAQSFDIFDDDPSLVKDRNFPVTATGGGDVLRELSHGQSQRRVTPASGFAVSSSLAKSPQRGATSPENKTPNSQIGGRTSRARRPQVDSETFEPLGAVPEETSSLIENEEDLIAISPNAKSSEVKGHLIQSSEEGNHHQLCSPEPKFSLEEQVEKHLAGQFEWIMTCPAEISLQTARCSQDEHKTRVHSVGKLYGCNLLPARRRRTSPTKPGFATDMYKLLATPLDLDSYPTGQKMDGPKAMNSPVSVGMSQVPPPPYPGTPLKVPDVVNMVEQALSPSLSVMSERSPSLAAGSSRTGSFSIPRIEDSLEELDRLEEELEAVHDLTRTRAPTDANEKGPKVSQSNPATLSDVKAPTAAVSKRASVAGYSATVRVKPSQKERPSLRRSASLTLREKRQAQQGSSESPKPEANASRGQSSISRLSTPKYPIKSAKPPTVPKFELPGEAVARRLKEQREARQAQQQAAAQKTQAPAPKPRTSKPLPKPTFELPGEAISRRKREEREAKLKAEEEEQRKRREFKARPVRQSIGPASLPRETLTSRARQSRGSPETNGDDGIPGAQRKRMAVSTVRSSLVSSRVGSSPQARGRDSAILNNSAAEASRATSTSTGSVSGKRVSISQEELHVQRQRGKDIFTRDNCYTYDREQGKREREMAAKTAREQAAERSRIASREWAEKKRRKELAAKQGKSDQV